MNIIKRIKRYLSERRWKKNYRRMVKNGEWLSDCKECEVYEKCTECEDMEKKVEDKKYDDMVHYALYGE